MKSIAFIDTEIEPRSGRILDIGCIKDNGSFFHKASISGLIQFLNGTQYICGHNVFNHDIKYLGKEFDDSGIKIMGIIDTLYLSPLLFPSKPYHALLKDDKLQLDEANNPLSDSIKAKDLFFDEVAAFNLLDNNLKQIFYLLLNDKKEFKSFFNYIGYAHIENKLEPLIRQIFHHDICENSDLIKIISTYPVELAYCLSLINANNRYSITPPWVLMQYPEVERIMYRLRNKPCITGCTYCNRALDIHLGLKNFFGFDTFRTFGGEPLQEKAVKAAVDNKSILVVFPTGGGKSLTFQVPALMSGKSVKGLTVVISPLQSLMKDQVDNLEKIGITEAVTINGLLDPIERAKSLERVEDGSASILYISPESLRSKTIEHLLLGRKLVRFVIDEAHCFSSWGQDFRVDYLYIADFIKSIQEKKNLTEGIPVSCFTATAKQKVIEDICDYFRQKLSLDLELFTSNVSRTNLQYKVIEKTDDEEKYQTLRDLIEEKNCPTIIYVSRTRKAELLANRLTTDGFCAKHYHGKMDIREKTENQNAFISGEVPIMVATSAFGMGVDKKDVGLVVHYEISDSLENYIQEAGRAGRDEKITADCFVLFNEEDLSKHFILLNQTKISIKEIQQIWKAIKEITRFRSTVSNSALEIARMAGWDNDITNIETKVITAIAALEDAGYLKRGQNMPRIFANSILSKNAQEAITKINASDKFEDKQKEKAVRIIKKLFSSRSRKQLDDEAESRVDYISDHLGIVKEEVINIINLLRAEKILADAKDLTAFIKKGEQKNRSLAIVESFGKMEELLLSIVEEEEKTVNIKEILEKSEEIGLRDVTSNKIKTIVNFWAIKNWIKQHSLGYSKNHIGVLCVQPKYLLTEKLKKRYLLSKCIVDVLFEKSISSISDVGSETEEVLIEFSVLELKEAFESRSKPLEMNVTLEDIEDTLFYLSRIDAIKIEGGFLVVYNRLTIERLESDNKKRYKVEDYQKLNQYYENKVQQIHIVGEYAKKMISDYKEALQFVEDYFQLNYESFLGKYFKGSRQNEIKRALTPAKFKQLFGELSPTQLKIINDKSKYMVVAAGPGSGKTRVLIHKLASLILMEDVKCEQLLMLTFSRAAATEFKKRLLKLIGNAANFVVIKTFHAYCFDLLGKIGSLEKSDTIINQAVEKIRKGEVEPNKITKTVLVVDEAQDMDGDEFELINTLMECNEEMRVIAVGDDDQNIYEFRGSSSKYLFKLIEEKGAIQYDLIVNYRSRHNLVDFSNHFVQRINNRLKKIPIEANQIDNGAIKIIHYQSNNLIEPVVQDLLFYDLIGTTCVLTRDNDAALQITGLLLKNGMQARLIQTNIQFNLYNLWELRFFLELLKAEHDNAKIDNEIWEQAKKQLQIKFQNSTKLNLCKNLIKDFESTHSNKYLSDLEAFIRESKLEDFYLEKGETIYVSTIHKSKGNEFDNVFLLLENYTISKEEEKRLLYVAMTRAKRNLIIHTNSLFLDNIFVENLDKVYDDGLHLKPEVLVMHLTLKDVWLDYFIPRQSLISQLICGQKLIVSGSECLNSQGQSVLKFSRSFLAQIEDLKKKNYEPTEVSVNFILLWKKAEDEEEIRIILPELHFARYNP